MAKQTKKYVNGMFTKRVNGTYGEFFKIGLLQKDFLAEVSLLKPDSRGFVNLIMSSQKADPSKYSVYVDTWEPPAKDDDLTFPEPQTSKPSYGSTYSKPTTTDDLPF